MENHVAPQQTVLFKRTRHHKGSIYCMSWMPDGSLIATGSYDRTFKLMRFNADTSNLEGQEIELTVYDGAVRDVCFIEDTSNRSSLLISGGAGDCKIYVTDYETGQPYQALSGHSGDLTTTLPSVVVAQHQDKVISRRWHPTDFSFLSTSADKTTTLWALPPYK